MDLRKALSVVARSLIPNRPYHAQWMLTRKCNYRCKGCNVWRERGGEELPTEGVKEGLNILKKLGVVEVVLSGGNPLLRDDIDEIIEYASRLFITTVYDNGSMAAEKVDALRNADFIAISIDSLDPDKNDYVKGVKGAWDKAMRAIERLREEGIRVTVSPTISQINVYEIISLTKFFLSKGVPLWYCLYSYDRPADLNQLFKIGREDVELNVVDKLTIVKLCDALIEMMKGRNDILVTTDVLKAIKRLYSDGRRTWRCRALRSFLIVDHLGRVAGCHVHGPVASIFDLPKMWNSQKFNALRETYSKCTGCTYLCYMFYSLYGTVLGNLRIAKERWRSAGLLLRKSAFK